ncbi:Fe2+-dependent dioxygenase [Asticcacaulis sp. 201]|uniref:Fe2+-dependent dioxygenase n=1 Tax=Asticcacaulis sp. 201 TaxID=3028787 RepID=UPI002916D6F0|nr:Fe2+-dependent dioxygenase [Asticcacaulis sp. 201]MDV6332181.1 Fe2+-dependent dioxygenase [Asticcacaulis sp. 201]
MMLHIPDVLTSAELTHIRGVLAQAGWTEGRHTTGAQAAGQKWNYQLPVLAPEAQPLADLVRSALLRHPLFQSAALPKTVLTPRFNAYEDGGYFGNHVDGAIQPDPVTQAMVRTDVSTTVFLSDPDDYDGGELVVEDTYGAHEVKLKAGDAILYPGTSIHRVEPVTRGMRLASFIWTQSMVRDSHRRQMLFDLDMTILKLRAQLGDTPEVVALTAHYHNLIRQWAEL